MKSNARRFDGGKKCCLVNLKPFFLTVVCPSLLVISYLAFLIERTEILLIYKRSSLYSTSLLEGADQWLRWGPE